MDIKHTIKSVFFTDDVSPVDDAYIEENTDILWLDGKPNLLHIVPSYMLWCARYKDGDGNLVIGNTIHALAEYGRAKNPDNTYLNFKFLCSAQQKTAVLAFLQWLETENLIVDRKQIQRACKSWIM